MQRFAVVVRSSYQYHEKGISLKEMCNSGMKDAKTRSQKVKGKVMQPGSLATIYVKFERRAFLFLQVP